MDYISESFLLYEHGINGDFVVQVVHRTMRILTRFCMHDGIWELDTGYLYS
jgi:hypothetical protein